MVHKNKTKIQMVNNHNQIIRIYHGKNIKIKKLNKYQLKKITSTLSFSQNMFCLRIQFLHTMHITFPTSDSKNFHIYNTSCFDGFLRQRFNKHLIYKPTPSISVKCKQPTILPRLKRNNDCA